MTDPLELHARLLDDARRYDPTSHQRGLLGPYRDVILLWRAKFMSYEQIAAALTRNGLKVSPAGVGVFCRRSFSKEEIMRERKRVQLGTRTSPTAVAPSSRELSAPATVEPPPTARRGPKIARDDY